MVIYIVLEGVLAKTLTGSEFPQKISDLKLGWKAFEWLKTVPDLSDIVILSNQTWIYGGPGIRSGEKFWSKLKYVSECLREELELAGKSPKITDFVAIKKPWIHGLQTPGPNLVQSAWSRNPDLIGQESIFVCRPIDFDVMFAKSMGFTNIKTDLC
jgi:hypothetical protein